MKIINIMAASLDGGTALHPGESDSERHSYQFSSADDFAFVVETVKTADAIIVGKSTVDASGLIDTKNGTGINYPDWYIFTNNGFPAGHPLLDSPVPITFVSQDILPSYHYKNGAEKIIFRSENPARTLVDHLKKKGKKTVLLLGGGTLNRLFYKESLVDELYLTLCPIILGSENAVRLVQPPLAEPVNLSLKSSKVVGNLVFLKYRVQNQSSN